MKALVHDSWITNILCTSRRIRIMIIQVSLHLSARLSPSSHHQARSKLVESWVPHWSLTGLSKPSDPAVSTALSEGKCKRRDCEAYDSNLASRKITD
jgi:hypothetical protein